MSELSGGVKVGLLLPTWCSPPDTLRWSELLDLAKAAQAAGFKSIWASDHMLLESTNGELRRRAGSDVPIGIEAMPEGYMEAFTVLAALAAAVPDIELGTLVACTGYRNPALLAKIADAVDEISGGRFTLGVGAGDSDEEHGVFGFPIDHRMARFEEALTVIRKLLREGRLDFQGTYYTVRECQLLPRGPRPNGPPIMIGTLNPRPRMLRLVAQYADVWNGWLAFGTSWPAAIRTQQDLIGAACNTYGRDPASLVRTAGVSVVIEGSFYAPMSGEKPIQGSAEQIAAALADFGRSGVAELQVVLTPCTRESIKTFGMSLASLDRS